MLVSLFLLQAVDVGVLVLVAGSLRTSSSHTLLLLRVMSTS